MFWFKVAQNTIFENKNKKVNFCDGIIFREPDQSVETIQNITEKFMMMYKVSISVIKISYFYHKLLTKILMIIL